MNDGINRKRFYSRFSFWMIVFAITFSIGFLLAGCVQPDAPMREPRPESREVTRYRLPVNSRDKSVEIIEFRDSAGRLCVLVHGTSGRSALSCAPPLASIDYERLLELPEPTVTPIPGEL